MARLSTFCGGASQGRALGDEGIISLAALARPFIYRAHFGLALNGAQIPAGGVEGLGSGAAALPAFRRPAFVCATDVALAVAAIAEGVHFQPA